MDEMQEYELHDLYNAMEYANLADWQQTRYIVYAIAQANSTKKLKMTDLMKLPSDPDYKKETIEHDIELSNKEKETLKKEADRFAKILAQQKII